MPIIPKSEQGIRIGYGQERSVFHSPDYHDKVVGVERDEVNPQYMKACHYTTAILHELFPNNFPTYYATVGGTQSKSVMAKVDPARHIENIPDYYTQRALEALSHEFILNLQRALGIRPFIFDLWGNNWALGENGQPIYLDKISPLDDAGYKFRRQHVVKDLYDRTKHFRRGQAYVALDEGIFDSEGKIEPEGFTLDPDRLLAYVNEACPEKHEKIELLYKRYAANAREIPILFQDDPTFMAQTDRTRIETRQKLYDELLVKQ